MDVNRDWHMEKILGRLSEISDDEKFEECAVDLLRQEWPTLVPAPGGNDAGTDGVFSDGGERGILVATTAFNVIGNVDSNLKSHLKKGRRGSKVLVAMTQELTNDQARKVEARIEALGFQSAHRPYGRQAIAHRLYHNSRWLKELLGLSGLASALSSIPQQLRPFRDLPLIGRDRDLEWLRTTEGDKLIVGQPGMGKTFLCQRLVDERLALYAVSDDIGTLVDSIRDQEPSTIIIEDAHQRCDTIRRLRHFREECGAAFKLVADCWPGSREAVQQEMGIPTTHCLELTRLPRASIVEIARAAGIAGPNWLHHALVQQSVGCPGRAAMLAHACVTSDTLERVIDGTELASMIYPMCCALAGDRALHLLAAFALGGEQGVAIEVVGGTVGASPLEVRTTMEKLAFGGLVVEQEPGVLTVLPEPLRAVMVRDFFFSRQIRQDWRAFIGKVKNLGAMCKTIVGAYERGAAVPTWDLVQLLQRSNDKRAIEAFAWSGVNHAKIVVEHYPEMVLDLSKPLLTHVPELAVPLILEHAIADDRPLHSHPEHGLRLIEEWIVSALPGTGQAVPRRMALWKALDKWIATGKDQRVALRALQSAVTLRVETHEQSATDRNAFTFIRTTLPSAELRELGEIWRSVLDRLSSLNIVSWPSVLEAVDEWVYPGRASVRFNNDQLSYCRETAELILQTITRLASGRPGVLSEVCKRSSNIGTVMDVSIDEDFARLFPDDPIDDRNLWRERSQKQFDAAQELASRWALSDPQTVVAKLMWCIGEAKLMNHPWPDFTTFVIEETVRTVDAVTPWLDALISIEAPATIIASCLGEACKRREVGWRERATKSLRNDSLVTAALPVLLAEEGHDFEDEALLIERCRQNVGIIEQLCRNQCVPEARLRLLLIDSDQRLAGAVAEGIWDGLAGAPVPAALLSEWREAACQSNIAEHSLCAMFRIDATLASNWLKRLACGRLNDYHLRTSAIAAACEQLSHQDKLAILKLTNPKAPQARDVVRAAIGDDMDLYQELLEDSTKMALHLTPLERKPDQQWAALAMRALDTGIEIEEVAAAGGWATHAAFGPVPSKYDDAVTTWDVLLQHPDPRIRAVAEIGRRNAETESKFWRQRDEKEEFRESYC